VCGVRLWYQRNELERTAIGADVAARACGALLQPGVLALIVALDAPLVVFAYTPNDDAFFGHDDRSMDESDDADLDLTVVAVAEDLALIAYLESAGGKGSDGMVGVIFVRMDDGARRHGV
jgi:hypothetical protein